MSKKFKSQASSARAASSFGGFGAFQTAASPLSYIAEQPDLSHITQSNVVVALKNLSKKDSTTKAKALDDLLDSLKDSTDIAVLTAWSDLYPRASIDNSQIVRRNAHTLQGQLTAIAGKSIAPLLPKIIPSWLAGTYDNDKSVARAASDALDRTFTTPEKKTALWRVYKDAIYERVEDALLTQTTTTLSDERTTSPDEAEAKYVRVVSTGMRLLSHMLNDGLQNHQILQEKKLWECVYHEDSYIRNSACSLLLAVLSQNIQDLDWKVLSTCFLNKGLSKSQTGSSRAYAQCLCKMTEARPSLWTSDYSAKTSASKRLLQYLRQGSQNGPGDVWPSLAHLIQLIPLETWQHSSDDDSVLVEAYRSGVLSERVHIDAAWSSYIDVCERLSKQIEATTERDDFIERNLTPIVTSYVSKASDEKWRIGGRSEKTAASALRLISDQSTEVVNRTWIAAVDSTVEKMRLSLPESSKEFRSSQDAVAAQGKRLLSLRKSGGAKAIRGSADAGLLDAVLDLLKTRNGKPYGAASILDELLQVDKLQDSNVKQFLANDLERLLDSPSCEQLVAVAMRINHHVGLTLFQFPSQSPNIIRGAEYFLRNATPDQLEDEQLQTSIFDRIGTFDNDVSRALALSLLANPQLQGHALKTRILSKLVSGISTLETQHSALSMLEATLAQPVLAKELISSEQGSQLAAKLLLLADATDTSLSDRASALSAAMNSRGNIATSSVPIIHQQLKGEGDSLSILTLTDLGLKSITGVAASDLLPTAEDWQAGLLPHVSSTTLSSLAITSQLRGAIWSVDASDTKSLQVVRDSEDFSLLFRIVFFVTKVFATNKEKLLATSGPSIDALHEYYPISLQLVNEKITVDDANDIWLGSTDEVLQAAADVLSEGLQLLQSWQEDERFTKFWLAQGHAIEGHSRQSYLKSAAFVGIASSLIDRQSREVMQEYEVELSTIHKSKNTLQSAALLAAVGELLLATQSGLKLVNELIADTTQNPSGLDQVMLLNILLKADTSILEKIPQQRLVFLFKSIVDQVKELDGKPSIISESFILASQVAPFVQQIYGEHWENLVQALSSAWEVPAKDDITILHSSLLVYAQLKKLLKTEEVNDDLQEAWSANKMQLDNGMLRCLESLSTTSEEVDQPRFITAELLRRQLDGVVVPNNVDIYALLASGLPAIRRAAYDLLHRTIPSEQEQISIDLALEQKVAQLPTELMHLINDKADTQRYLLSWKVVFDHYPKASHKLREAYTTDLKASNSVEGLLDFVCEILRIASGRPLDATRFEVAEYDLDVSESYERDVQWLSVHLYYQSLMLIPGLVKDWFLQQKNRIKQPLESWTQKHMSPLIVASSLAIVTEWSASQSTSDDDRPVEIKASPRGSEIVASIAVDPESPPISLAISLPSAYPLESPVVTSRTRVGVSEKNWTSWLRTFQIIIFSSGSIIEGLVAFRRNVQGALKGQSECAICYSIIGTDMQTPNKKCGTCKNMFHGVCLFRWFKSSNSSSCPLCRNNFNYA